MGKYTHKILCIQKFTYLFNCITICSCDSAEDIEVADMEATNEVEEAEEEADDDSTNQNTCLYLHVFSEICYVLIID